MDIISTLFREHSNQAREWVRKHHQNIVQRWCSLDKYPQANEPYIMFMAGLPGVGKTELSRHIIDKWKSHHPPILAVRLDTDDFREIIPGYTGANSDEMQSGATLLMEKCLDFVFHHHQNVLVDTTLTDYLIAQKNIDRALKHGYKIFITCVCQNPLKAWFYAKTREKVEGRTVPEKTFLISFTELIKTIHHIKDQYKKNVQVDIIIKNSDNDGVLETPYNVSLAEIDKYINMCHNIPIDTLKSAMRDISKKLNENAQ